MKTIGVMLQLLDGLRGTKDISSWEDQFIASCMHTSKQGTLTAHLSGLQVEKIEQIYQKHFDGAA